MTAEGRKIAAHQIHCDRLPATKLTLPVIGEELRDLSDVTFGDLFETGQSHMGVKALVLRPRCE